MILSKDGRKQVLSVSDAHCIVERARRYLSDKRGFKKLNIDPEMIDYNLVDLIWRAIQDESGAMLTKVLDVEK